MRQRLAIIITVLVVLVILIGLNAASYVEVEQPPDSEQSPDRSTFNSGPTGTRALYDFLHESGYQVARWREPPSALLSINGPKPVTLVIVGRTLVRFTKPEREDVLRRRRAGVRQRRAGGSPPRGARECPDPMSSVERLDEMIGRLGRAAEQLRPAGDEEEQFSRSAAGVGCMDCGHHEFELPVVRTRPDQPRTDDGRSEAVDSFAADGVCAAS